MKFSDPAHQQNFSNKGYITTPLLNAEEVAELLSIFESIREQHSFPFTLCSPSYDLKKKVFELLKDKLQPALSSLLEDYRITGANFYFKAKGSQNNKVPPHQDWTFTDETQFSSLNVWVPLVDVDKTNGAYHVIDGSNQWEFTYRGSNIPSAAANLDCNFDELQYLPLKKGEGIIYDHRLIHTTPANISETDRISLVLNVVTKEATLIHAIMPEPTTPLVKVYEVDEEFYWKYTFSFSKNEMPEGYSLLREEKYEVPDFSKQHVH